MSLKISEFDAIVIGSNLSGLMVAAGLSQNQRVALIDKNELPGGNFSRINQFQTIPASAETERTLDFLDLLIGRNIKREKIEQHPITFEQGFKPFVGFGDNAPICVDEIQYYLSPERFYFHEGPQDWLQILFEKFKGEFFNLSEVTKIIIENNEAKGVVINGQRQLNSKKIIFCSNPKDLVDLIPQESLPPRLRQKLGKSMLWTSVLLQLVHSQLVSEDTRIHMLGQKSETDGFCVGQFFSPIRIENGSVTQRSQWLTFISEADADDEELLGQSIRKLKKLIQKAFPNAFSELKYEKIMVNPSSHGKISINLEENTSIEGISGLYVVSHFPSELQNISGSLDQAEQCLRGLGFCAAP
ncbi:MAG: hypothetical protein A4S09_08490 [Proteobacteria bacterium SG_bin7]|nr:MAG: hypothetical protein A4S09_08490 [Proteobacteria bacterium SG_bin7]